MTSFPVSNDHHAMFREIGNTYNRQYYDEYLSSISNIAGLWVCWGTITWDDSLPSGSSIDMMIRVGHTPLSDTTWSDWLQFNKDDSIPDSLDFHIYMQYKAVMRYTNPAYLPILYSVQIDYELVPGVAENVVTSEKCFNIHPTIITDHSLISYSIKENTDVKVAIYDITGQCVAVLVNSHQGRGQHTVSWNGCDNSNKRLPSGRYYAVLSTEDETKASQFIQLR